MPNYGIFINHFINFLVELTGRQPANQPLHLIHENSLQGGQPLKRMIFKRGKVDCDMESNDDETVIESDAFIAGYLKANTLIIKVGGKFTGTLLVEELQNHGFCSAENSLISKLRAFSGSTLEGDITFTTLEVENGAVIKATLYPEGSEFSQDISSIMTASIMDRDTTGSSKEAAMTSSSELDEILGITAGLDDPLSEE